MIRYGKPSTGIFAGALLATALVGSAFADMVYDDETSAASASEQMSAAPTQIQVTEKTAITTETISTAPVVAEAPKLQKVSEKSREKRGFQESMNNELVVQKLEERRLKQEEKLTAEINKRFTLENEEAPAGSAAPVMKEEKIVKPITEAPAMEEVTVAPSYQMSVAPKAQPVAAAPIAQDQLSMYQSSTSMSPAPFAGSSQTAINPEGDKLTAKKSGGVSIVPRAGLSTLTTSAYSISPKFMTGVGLGFDVSDHVGVEFGYSYSELGVRMNSGYGPYMPLNELQYKNNMFDMGMKLYLSGLDAKVRPYIGGGMAYSMGYINYDEQLQQRLLAFGQWYRASDYRLNQFQAMAQAGIDFKVASNISLGAAYKFLKPLSSSETEEGLAYGYFYGQPVDLDKQTFRGTIKDSNTNVFQVSASVTF